MSAPWLALAGTFRSGLGATRANHARFGRLSSPPGGKDVSNNDSASVDKDAISITPCQRHVRLSANSSTDANLLLAPSAGAKQGAKELQSSARPVPIRTSTPHSWGDPVAAINDAGDPCLSATLENEARQSRLGGVAPRPWI